MSEFIELTEIDGENILLNVEHILKVRPDEKGCYVYFDFLNGSNGTVSPSVLHVSETYTVVKRRLQQ